ncbi:OmpA family protein [Pseudoxanthomonas sp. SL93]|uniref:OmpA family protein n=1 Tax=Pseudoxanthomonas sp. SL93 TaxID=2995142 RepID=UPI00226FFC00|nr:OmpA family protein [Pseudoxanthomonas sp. SL93]WAC64961.1 OmpA family protein [Pseudoxanthomonas sp. SL93]
MNGWLGDASGAAAPHASAPIAAGELLDARLAKVYFDTSSAVVPADTSARMASVLGTLHADPDVVAHVSGYHDASGDLAANQELAKQRAQAIQQWLVVNGVDAERITLEKPVQTEGNGSADAARRVEVKIE